MEAGVCIVVISIGVGPLGKQPGDDIAFVVINRDMQGGPPITVGPIEVGFLLEQKLAGLEGPLGSRTVKRCPSIPRIGGVRVKARFEKQTDDFRQVFCGCSMNRQPLIRIAEPRVGSHTQKKLNHIRMVFDGSQVQRGSSF